MTAGAEQPRAGHAFISYVHEDRANIDKLHGILDSAGLPVWRDTEDLWPGEDWKLKIRKAITNESLAFIACFSKNSNARESTYQNEELVLAVEQMRKRAPGGNPWLIPVRLDDCSIPDYDIGAGRLLNSLQAVDLFGENRERGTSRLIASVMRILATAAPGMPVTAKVGGSQEIVAQVKEMLLDPTRRIELHDLVMSLTNDCRTALTDATRFSLNYEGGDRGIVEYAVGQVDEYWQAVKPVAEILAVGCTWGEQHHEKLWTNAARTIANIAKLAGGKTILINLRALPAIIVLYAVGIASVYGDNYGALRAVAIEAQVRTEHKGAISLVGASHVSRPFDNSDLVANIVAYQACNPDGKTRSYDELFDGFAKGSISQRYTPVSDYLHNLLRDTFRFVLPDDDDYTEVFDKLEAFLAALTFDVKEQAYKTAKVYTDPPWFGSFTWRNLHSGMTSPEVALQTGLAEAGASWPPLQAGLFGGSVDRASAAFKAVVVEAGELRSRRM